MIDIEKDKVEVRPPLQECPNCNEAMNAMPGSRDAVCRNCGFKDPCCE